MKILLVQDYLRSGGTERQSVLLANAFAAAGHASTLLTFRPGGPLAPTLTATVHRLALQSLDTQLDWFAPGLLNTVAQLAPDLVLCMGRMANCYAGSLQKRLSIEPADSVVIATMRTGKNLPWLFQRSLHLVQHVVANSHEARDTLTTRHGIDPGKISVIHNSLVFPADDTRRSAAAEALRREHGATPTTTVLLCVAMFRPEKNQRELIEIAARLPAALDWQLWLAGEGPARAACEQRTASSGLSARVKFTGFVADPSSLYGAADLAVHASGSESLSNFLIEAQARGLPVIACEAQGIRECFVPDRTGWAIARGDHAAFAGAIQRLASLSESERKTLAAEARQFARATFDPARQVTAYLDLFVRLSGSR